MNHSLEYWKKRCELAEKALKSEDAKDWYKWENFKNSCAWGIDQTEAHKAERSVDEETLNILGKKEK